MTVSVNPFLKDYVRKLYYIIFRYPAQSMKRSSLQNKSFMYTGKVMVNAEIKAL